jgi:hypothetical protein
MLFSSAENHTVARCATSQYAFTGTRRMTSRSNHAIDGISNRPQIVVGQESQFDDMAQWMFRRRIRGEASVIGRQTVYLVRLGGFQ